jgi:predicted N-acetyltransferase YhbS
VAVTQRRYNSEIDFDAVSDFLVRHYLPENQDGNCFQPIWEYSYYHRNTDSSAFDRIGIWEDDGRIVAVAFFETLLGDVYLNTHPEYQFLKPEMLPYVEKVLTGLDDRGKSFCRIYVNDFDTELRRAVRSRGFRRDTKHDRAMSQFRIPDPFPRIDLPQGFVLTSLAEDNDLRKVHRVLHRGFNHPGEPPEDGLEGRKKMQSAPHFRKDLNIVVEARNGDFVSYCGMWYDQINRFGYVEPVATDPDYRRLGLASAAVLEGIRRCADEGATVAYVGTDKPLYLSIGFKKLFSQHCWTKSFRSKQFRLGICE